MSVRQPWHLSKLLCFALVLGCNSTEPEREAGLLKLTPGEGLPLEVPLTKAPQGMANHGPNQPQTESINRLEATFEEVRHANGDVYVIQTTRYTNGKTFRFLAAVWLPTPLPIEIVLLDDVIVPNETLPSSSHSDNPQPLPSPPLPSAQSGEGPLAPEHPTWHSFDNESTLIVRGTDLIVDSGLFLTDPQALEAVPTCKSNELRGFARIKAPALHRMDFQISSDRGGKNAPFFLKGRIVCLSVRASSVAANHSAQEPLPLRPIPTPAAIKGLEPESPIAQGLQASPDLP